MMWFESNSSKKKSLVSEKRGKKFYKACERRFESRDKNHPQKSIVKIFFLLLLAISTRRVLNLCNRRALFNGISTINFIYCHMLMISPFERYWQCWFSKALNIRLICVWKRLLSLVTVHSEKTLWHSSSPWIFYFILTMRPFSTHSIFIFRRLLTMMRWGDENSSSFCITNSTQMCDTRRRTQTENSSWATM